MEEYGRSSDGIPLIREMKRFDFSQVLPLLSQLTEQGEACEQDFANFMCHTWHYRLTRVLEVDGKILAIGSIFFMEKLKGLVGQIEDVVVDHNERGKGYGEKIVRELVRIASEKECYKVILNCSDENVGFYEKVGFGWHENQMRLKT